VRRRSSPVFNEAFLLVFDFHYGGGKMISVREESRKPRKGGSYVWQKPSKNPHRGISVLRCTGSRFGFYILTSRSTIPNAYEHAAKTIAFVEQPPEVSLISVSATQQVLEFAVRVSGFPVGVKYIDLDYWICAPYIKTSGMTKIPDRLHREVAGRISRRQEARNLGHSPLTNGETFPVADGNLLNYITHTLWSH